MCKYIQDYTRIMLQQFDLINIQNNEKSMMVHNFTEENPKLFVHFNEGQFLKT